MVQSLSRKIKIKQKFGKKFVKLLIDDTELPEAIKKFYK